NIQGTLREQALRFTLKYIVRANLLAGPPIHLDNNRLILGSNFKFNGNKYIYLTSTVIDNPAELARTVIHEIGASLRLPHNVNLRLEKLSNALVNLPAEKFSDAELLAERSSELKDKYELNAARYESEMITPLFKDVVSDTIEEYSAGMKALDVGTGTGLVPLMLIRHDAKEVVGVDISNEMLKIASSNCRAFNNVRFIQGDAANIPGVLRANGINGDFDIITSAALLMLYTPEQIRSMLKDWNSVLNKGGYIVLFSQTQDGGTLKENKDAWELLFRQTGYELVSYEHISNICVIQGVKAEPVVKTEKLEQFFREYNIEPSKTILFAMSGGDCPGPNSALYGAIQEAVKRGHRVLGVLNGFEGLGANPEEFVDHLVIFTAEGSMRLKGMPSIYIGSSRAAFKDKKANILKNAQQFKGVVFIGGDDHSKQAGEMAAAGIPTIIIPKTIDYDFKAEALGAITAAAEANRLFIKFCQMAREKKFISVIEFMGRDAGWITYLASKGMADLILVPEKLSSFRDVLMKALDIIIEKGYLNAAMAEGYNFKDFYDEHKAKEDTLFYILLDIIPPLKAKFYAKGQFDVHGNPKLSGISEYLSLAIRYLPQLAQHSADLDLTQRYIQIKMKYPQYFGQDLRYSAGGQEVIINVCLSILGYVLRGLTPNEYDDKLGQLYGRKAVQLLLDGKTGLEVTVPKVRDISAAQDLPVDPQDVLAVPVEAVAKKEYLNNIFSDQMLAESGVWWRGYEFIRAYRPRLAKLIALGLGICEEAKKLFLSAAISARAHEAGSIVGFRGVSGVSSDEMTRYAASQEISDNLTADQCYVLEETKGSTIVLLSTQPMMLRDLLLKAAKIMLEEVELRDDTGRVVERSPRGYVNIAVSDKYKFLDFVDTKERNERTSLFYRLLGIDAVLKARYEFDKYFFDKGRPGFVELLTSVTSAITYLPQLAEYDEQLKASVDELRSRKPEIFGKDPAREGKFILKGIRLSMPNHVLGKSNTNTACHYPICLPMVDGPRRKPTKDELKIIIQSFGGEEALRRKGIVINEDNVLIGSYCCVDHGILYVHPHLLRGPPEQLRVIFEGHELYHLSKQYGQTVERNERGAREFTVRYLLENELLESHIRFLENYAIDLVPQEDWLRQLKKVRNEIWAKAKDLGRTIVPALMLGAFSLLFATDAFSAVDAAAPVNRQVLLDCLQLVFLGIFHILFLGRSAQLLRRGVNPFAVKSLREIAFPFGVLIWSGVIIAGATGFDLPGSLFAPLFSVDSLRYLSCAFTLSSLVLFGWALVSFGKSWRVGIDSKAAGKLITSGAFAVSRNPVFLSFDLYFVSAFLYFQNTFFFVFAALAIAGTYKQILEEEKFLAQYYGVDYSDYAAKVNRFFAGSQIKQQWGYFIRTARADIGPILLPVVLGTVLFAALSAIFTKAAIFLLSLDFDIKSTVVARHPVILALGLIALISLFNLKAVWRQSAQRFPYFLSKVREYLYPAGDLYVRVSDPNNNCYMTSQGVISVGISALHRLLYPYAEDYPGIIIAPRGEWTGRDGSNIMQLYHAILCNFMIHKRNGVDYPKARIVCRQDQAERIKGYLKSANPSYLPNEAGYPQGLIDRFNREAVYLADRAVVDGETTMISALDMIEFEIFSQIGEAKLGDIVIFDRKDGTFVIYDRKKEVSILDGRNIRELALEFIGVRPVVEHPEFGVSFLGTSSGFDSEGIASNHIIWAGKQHILVDATAATMSIISGLKLSPARITHVLMTHVHEDHVAGALGYFRWCKENDQPIRLIAEPGIYKLFKEQAKQILDGELDGIYDLELIPLKFYSEPVILGDGDEKVIIETAPAFHTTPVSMLRFTYKGRTISCSGDTAFDPIRFGQIVDNNIPGYIREDLRRETGSDEPVFDKKRATELKEFLFRDNASGKTPSIIIHDAASDNALGRDDSSHTTPFSLDNLPERIQKKMMVNHTAKLPSAKGVQFEFNQAIPMTTVEADLENNGDFKISTPARRDLLAMYAHKARLFEAADIYPAHHSMDRIKQGYEKISRNGCECAATDIWTTYVRVSESKLSEYLKAMADQVESVLPEGAVYHKIDPSQYYIPIVHLQNLPFDGAEYKLTA
ncbi:MAG: 6-phosphofructokinase, partial [Candidatus Omnitrophica bacterium]|nr:6-phosphofructokinase [Candidatus Omnitrophota bacterium]